MRNWKAKHRLYFIITSLMAVLKDGQGCCGWRREHLFRTVAIISDGLLYLTFSKHITELKF